MLGGLARRGAPRHRQTDLAAESGEARIVLVAQDEGVEEKVLDARIPVATGPIEPLEGCLRICLLRRCTFEKVPTEGRFYTLRDTEADLRKAIEYYAQAIALDRHYALAWSELSRAARFDVFAGKASARARRPEARLLGRWIEERRLELLQVLFTSGPGAPPP
jgi:hypothetical protein